MLQTLTFVFLFPALDDRVLIVIGGDDNYSGEETSKVLSRWAKMKISSQFSTEYLDGRKSFVFSWEQKHRHIHKDALLHFLDKKGEVFVPKPRPLPTVLERNMGEKVLAGELTFQSKPNQSQATHEQGPKSKDLSPQTVKQMPTEAGTPLEKKQIHPLQGDHIGTTGLSIDHKEQKPQNLNSVSAGAKSKLPQTDTEYHKKEQYNDQESKSRFYSQAKPIYPSVTHVSSPPYVPQSTKASLYGDRQSTFTNDSGEKKAKENVGNHSAAQEVHQKSGRGKTRGNEEAPTTSVHVAIIEYKVYDERSVQVAHAFVYEVAKQLKFNPNIVSIKSENPESLVQKFVSITKHYSLGYVVLLVDKEVFRNILTGKKELTSYGHLLDEIQTNAGNISFKGSTRK